MMTWHGDVAWRRGMATWHGDVAWRRGMATWHGDVARQNDTFERIEHYKHIINFDNILEQ